MFVGIIEMPAEGIWIVRVGEDKLPGAVIYSPEAGDKPWFAVPQHPDTTKMLAHRSKEGAMCVLLRQYFESQPTRPHVPLPDDIPAPEEELEGDEA